MRVAALYDIHGMIHPLEAVLAEVDEAGVDAIVIGGDVAAGPFPGQTLERVRSLDAHVIRGNADRESDDDWLRGLPFSVTLDGVLYVHATPRSDEEILTEASPEARFAQALEGVDNRLVVAGHTHMQFQRGKFVNAGSVGMPYEGEVAAFWALVEDDVEFRRTPFDVERAIADIEASGWPGAGEFVAENLWTAPSRQEAAEYFESLA